MLQNSQENTLEGVLLLLSCSLQTCKFTELFQAGFSREHLWTAASERKGLRQAFIFTRAEFTILLQQMRYTLFFISSAFFQLSLSVAGLFNELSLKCYLSVAYYLEALP